ncbi:MAG: YceI family protein [Planctomycetota bacterium]
MKRSVLAPALALTSLTLFSTASTPSSAEEVAFDFTDPKGVNGVVFVVDSELEPIVGMIGGVSGDVTFDPDNPAAINGSVSVDIAQLSFINPGMKGVLAGADWLNFENKFIATFEFEGVEAADDSEGHSVPVQTRGTMKFGGMDVAKNIVIEATHLPDAAADRGGAKEGDLLVLRAAFEISRKDLGIKEDMPGDKVGETISVIVPIVGYSK